MPRHRGKFNPESPYPYELSRSRIENFVQCPACFYLQQVQGVAFPSMPGFNINEATDVLLKRDFDKYREKQITHPYLENIGMGHLVPFKHDNFELWTQSLHFGAEGRFHIVHEPTNLKVGGGLDDVWLNTTTDQLHIVDYKSTSQKSEGKVITLDGKWKAAYKRQMDLYVWVMRNMGLAVSNTGYFLYCDGDRFTESVFLQDDKALMEFKLTLIPYDADTSWVEPTLTEIKNTLLSHRCPDHSQECEYGLFLKSIDEFKSN